MTYLLLLPLWFMPVPTPEIPETPWRLEAYCVDEKAPRQAKLSRREARRRRC